MKTPSQDYKPLKDRSFLEILQCDSLIQEIEDRIIINKEPYLHKTEDNVNCNELLYSFTLEPCIPSFKKFDLYFHLGDAKNIDFKISRKRVHKKLTLEDRMHKGVRLTLV